MLRQFSRRIHAQPPSKPSVLLNQHPRMFSTRSSSLGTGFVAPNDAVLRPVLLTMPVFSKSTRPNAMMQIVESGQKHQRHVLSYWKSALAASSFCIASSLMDDGEAHAAGRNAANDNDKDHDALEQLKRQVQHFYQDAISGMNLSLPSNMEDLEKQINEFIASGKGGQISWGFMMGAFTGFTMKKLSKAGAIAVGGIFIMMQAASYYGYIDVNYQKLERDVIDLLDLNKDGQFDTKDIEAMRQKIMKVLEFNLPAGSGFALGFAIGFRKG